ncbi:MAG TPA: tRNA pseudouridine(55) synthase TruB [Gemmataceae bacterium]|jgi:tRNA pseudouridine55 synthase
MPDPNPHGLLVLDKPVGLTSRDAVDRALRWFPRKTRVGHTGTLDPLASGVLVLCVGHATRLTEYVQDMGKTYVADVVLGARSATDDAEGPITPVAVTHPPDRATIDARLSEFVGMVEQAPPAFSAAKVTGQRAYDLARRGEAVDLAPRTVRIDRIDVVDFNYPRLKLEVRCGKGTYIRSLARDLGNRLGCGAYLDGLRRTRVGPFTPDDAVPLDTDAEAACSRLLPPAAAVAALPRVVLPPEAVARLKHGQAVTASEAVPAGTDVAVFDSDGVLVGIAAADRSGRTLRPSKVFPA